MRGKPYSYLAVRAAPGSFRPWRGQSPLAPRTRRDSMSRRPHRVSMSPEAAARISTIRAGCRLSNRSSLNSVCRAPICRSGAATRISAAYKPSPAPLRRGARRYGEHRGHGRKRGIALARRRSLNAAARPRPAAAGRGDDARSGPRVTRSPRDSDPWVYKNRFLVYKAVRSRRRGARLNLPHALTAWRTKRCRFAMPGPD